MSPQDSQEEQVPQLLGLQGLKDHRVLKDHLETQVRRALQEHQAVQGALEPPGLRVVQAPQALQAVLARERSPGTKPRRLDRKTRQSGTGQQA